MNLETTMNLGYNERGNTSLINPDTGGTALFAEIEKDFWLISICRPENYPAWSVYTDAKTTKEIRKLIEEEFCDTWFFQKNNIGANASCNSPIYRDYVMERVRDHLYIYRDNKDFGTQDTVTVIHNFLESKKWSLDIADIESLRQESDEA